MTPNRKPLPRAGEINDILVICSGNICRSPMATAILRATLLDAGVQGIRVHSAGTIAVTGSPASVEAIEVAEEHGLDILHHRSTPLTIDLIRSAGLILVMEESHLEKIVNAAPEAAGKIFLLGEFAEDDDKNREVSDPIGMPKSFYATVFAKMEKLIANFVFELQKS